jgi:hypothetical protein
VATVAPVVINTPPALLPKIEQPAKPLAKNLSKAKYDGMLAFRLAIRRNFKDKNCLKMTSEEYACFLQGYDEAKAAFEAPYEFKWQRIEREKQEVSAKIEQHAKPLEPVAKTPVTDLSAAQEQMANPEFFYKSKRRLIDAYLGEGRDRDTLPALLCKVQAIIKDKNNIYSDFASRLMENFSDWMDYREYKQANNPPSLTPKIEQPAKPLATTCNPDALRLRSKAIICRAANRPTWAEKLEAQADALERMENPEPPPGSKATPPPAHGCKLDG